MYVYLIWKCTVLKHTWLFSNVSNDQSFPIFFLIAIRYCVELTIILIFTIDTTSPTVLLVWTIPFTFQKRSWGIGIVLMAEQKLLQYISFATTTTFSFFWANKIRRVSYNDTLLSGPTIYYTNIICFWFVIHLLPIRSCFWYKHVLNSLLLGITSNPEEQVMYLFPLQRLLS